MRDFFASIQARLLLLVSVALVPILCLMVYTHQEQRNLAVTEAQQNALRLARLAASDQERLIEGARQLLIALAQLPVVQNQNAVGCSAFMANLLKQYPLYENLGAATLDGDIFCAALSSAMTVNMADRPFFRRTLETRDFVAGDYIIARITGRPALGTSYPALDAAGHLRAVVFAGIDLSWLDQFVAEAQLPEGSTLTVINNAGTILTRYPDPEAWRGKPMPASLMQPLLAQGEGVTDAEGLDGVPRLYAFTRLCCLQSGDIYVRVGIPLSVALAEANRTLARNLIALAVVSLVVFSLAGAGAHLFVLRPLGALLSVIERFEARDFSARIGQASGSGELGRVARGFDQMAATVQAREIERDRSEEARRLQSARAEALATIAGRLNAYLDLHAVLQEVCREAARALQVSAASVSLYDEKLNVLRLVSKFGLPDDFAAQVEALEWGTCTQRLENGEAVVVPDVRDYPEWPIASLFASLDIRTFVRTPLVHEGRLVGTLCVFVHGRVRTFAEDELAFLKATADQAAQAIANARLYDALRREERAHAALLEKTISAQEDERKRVARELHDQTSQDLSALMLSLDACLMGLATDKPGFERHVQTAKAIAEELLANTHRLINDLRPSLLDDLGLAPAMTWYGEQRLKPMGVSVEFLCDRMEERLPPSLETALFRIAQEALTNVARHAGASRVKIVLAVNDSGIFLAVEDNGSGFDMAKGELDEGLGRGLGLRGMRERATALGGELQVQSALGQGTAIRVTIPFLKEKRAGA